MALAQNQTSLLEKKVNITMSEEPIKKVLNRLEELGQFRFAYSPETFDDSKKVTVDFKQKPVKDILEKLFDGQGIEYKEMERKIVITRKRKTNRRRSLKVAPRQAIHKPLDNVKTTISRDSVFAQSAVLATDRKGEDSIAAKRQQQIIGNKQEDKPAEARQSLNEDFSFDVGGSRATQQKEIQLTTVKSLAHLEASMGFKPVFERPNLTKLKPDVIYKSPKFAGFKPKKVKKEKPDYDENKFRIYGASTTGIAAVGDELSILIGGKGAWKVNRNLGIGLAGYAYETSKGLDNLLSLTDFRHSGGYGGFLVEYTLAPENAVHVSFPLMVGGGAAVYSRKPVLGEKVVEDSKAMFVVEPGVELEFNVIRFVRMSFGMNYRYTTNTRLAYKSNQQEILSKSGLNGLTGAFSVKFGIF